VTERQRSVKRVAFDMKDLIFELYKEAPHILQSSGFINIHSIDKHMTLAETESANNRRNAVRVSSAMKAQILAQGGVKDVQANEDFEALATVIDLEMETTPSASKSYTMLYARKPFAHGQVVMRST
jgi:hypothetical protein